MVFQKIIAIAFIVQSVLGKPQLLTLKDGNVGVNFGGYHAEAGLGGLLTGNAAHGGLSASAGTPTGQLAGAGLGGSLDGRSAGGAYAGATAGGGVGASAGIGGELNSMGGHGGAGAESHIGGSSKTSVKLSETSPHDVEQKVTAVKDESASVDATIDKTFTTSGNAVYVQKVRKYNPNKFHFQKRWEIRQPQITNTVFTTAKPKVVQQQYIKGFNFQKFFNFGLFPNNGVQVPAPVVPKVVFEKRIVPQVVIEKKVIPQTLQVEKTVVANAPVIQKKVEVVNQVENTAGTSGSNSYQTNYAFSGYKNPTFFQDVFNIPISTLQAVNRLLSNKAAGGNFNFQKTFEAHAN